MDIDDILTKDRIKTREINLLVTENRALEARVAALTAALAQVRHDLVPIHAQLDHSVVVFPLRVKLLTAILADIDAALDAAGGTHGGK